MHENIDSIYLPVITYALEAIPLTKKSYNRRTGEDSLREMTIQGKTQIDGVAEF